MTAHKRCAVCNKIARGHPAPDGNYYCKNHWPIGAPLPKLVYGGKNMNIFKRKEPEQEQDEKKQQFGEHIETIRQGVPELTNKSDVEALNAVSEEPTLELKMTLSEMRTDYLAHTYLIAKTYAALAQLGMPEHIMQAEAERLVSPHRKRANDLAEVLRQYDEK